MLFCDSSYLKQSALGIFMVLLEDVNGFHTIMYKWQQMGNVISGKMYSDFRDFKLGVGGNKRDAF